MVNEGRDGRRAPERLHEYPGRLERHRRPMYSVLNDLASAVLGHSYHPVGAPGNLKHGRRVPAIDGSLPRTGRRDGYRVGPGRRRPASIAKIGPEMCTGKAGLHLCQLFLSPRGQGWCLRGDAVSPTSSPMQQVSRAGPSGRVGDLLRTTQPTARVGVSRR